MPVNCIAASIPLPLPLGEVAERSEDGEGRTNILSFKAAFPLSVTFGDSSPKGRGKSLFAQIIQKKELHAAVPFLLYPALIKAASER